VSLVLLSRAVEGFTGINRCSLKINKKVFEEEGLSK